MSGFVVCGIFGFRLSSRLVHIATRNFQYGTNVGRTSLWNRGRCRRRPMPTLTTRSMSLMNDDETEKMIADFEEKMEGWLEADKERSKSVDGSKKVTMRKLAKNWDWVEEEMDIERVETLCSGCGTKLQVEDEKRPGFVPKEVWDRRDEESQIVICQRCHNLQNAVEVASSLRVQATENGAHPESELTPETFRARLKDLEKIRSVVVYIVDVFDFHGSFLKDFPSLVSKKSTILLAVNKVDLLPLDFKEERVAGWVRQECLDFGIRNLESIHLVSCKNGAGLGDLMDEALKLSHREKADIYVVGAANVGKSTFINAIIQRTKDQKRGDAIRKMSKKELLTTSVVPGTTLNLVKIPIGGKRNMYDTPGLILPHQLTTLLNMEELKAVVPQKRVCYVTLRLTEGKSLFLGGLARIDFLEGRPFFFTSFVSGGVKIHPGRTEGAEEFTTKHCGGILTPPFQPERLKTFGPWSSKTLNVSGAGWKKATVDIVFSGLGWVSITGVGEIKIRISAPEVVRIFARDALMPFEIEKGASRFTGGHAVNPRSKPRRPRRA